MQYFKHYHNASSSLSVQKIVKEHGLVGYAQWFLLLELLCEKFDGESELVTVTVHEIANKLRSKPHLIVQCMDRFKGLADIKANIDDFQLIIECPLLLDLQDKDYRYAAKKRRENAKKSGSCDSKNKNKEEDKEEDKDKEYKTSERKSSEESSAEIHEKLNDEFLNPFLKKVKIETQSAWLKTYADEVFVKTELFKACTWIINNSAKAPKKNFGQFFSTWLGRGWETYRKSIPSAQHISRRPTVSEIAENQIANNPFRKGVA